MVRALHLALALATPCIVAEVPSCEQADEIVLLQGVLKLNNAESLQPSRQVPSPEERFRAWAAQNPILALKICEVPHDEVANAINDAEFPPDAAEAIGEFMDEHGAAAFQDWVRGVVSPQYSYPEPDLPEFTEPTELTALIPITNHPNRLYTQVLDETIYGDIGGRIIDGSMAHYYYRHGTGNVLVFFMDGGGSCGTDDNAQFHCNLWLEQKFTRHRQHGGRGPRRTFRVGDFDGNVIGPLDDNHPDFGDAHRIRVPYLSGDAYLGQVVSPSNPCQATFAADGSYDHIPDMNDCDMYTSGHLNVRNILHHFLSNQPGSREITRIFVTGTSAGGRSSIMNCDWFQEFMNTHGPKLGMQHVEVSCAPVAGFMLPGFTTDHEDPKSAPTPFPQWRIGEVRALEEEAAFSSAENVKQKWWLPRACRADQVPGEEWRCGSAPVAYPYIVPRTFVTQNKFDFMTKWLSFPMGAWGWPQNLLGPPPEEDASRTCEGQEYMKYYGDAMELSMQVVVAKPQDGLFFASCIDHTKNLLFGGEAVEPWGNYARTLVKGVDSLQAVADWFFEKGELPNVIADDCQTEMGVPCNEFCMKEIEDLGPSCHS